MLEIVGEEPGEATDGDGGDHHAWVEGLFAARYGELVGLAALILADRAAAEDVVQDVFAAVYRRTRPLDDPAAAAGYLRRAVVNGARSRLRHRAVERRHPAPPPPGDRSPEETAVAGDDTRAVAAAVARLPLRQRECVACHFQLDLTHAETAAVLGISIGSVKTHLHRATRRLARLLEDRR